jgi:hypothetical protein
VGETPDLGLHFRDRGNGFARKELRPAPEASEVQIEHLRITCTIKQRTRRVTGAGESHVAVQPLGSDDRCQLTGNGTKDSLKVETIGHS